MLIIDDETSGPLAMPPHLADVSCPDNCHHEVMLLFQQLLGYDDGAGRGFAEIQHLIDDNPAYMLVYNSWEELDYKTKKINRVHRLKSLGFYYKESINRS